MKRLQKISVFLLAIMLIFPMSTVSYAHDYVQMEKRGTITVTMHMGDKVVGGGTLTLYRVGEVRESDGDYTFQPTEDFTDCGESFDDVTSSALARNLAKYAAEKKLVGATQGIDKSGKVVFTDLKVGLYLLVQNEAASGYNKAAPFLVSLPYMQDSGQYSYVVDASPKVELDRPGGHDDPDEPDPPDEPDEPDSSDGSDEPDDPDEFDEPESPDIPAGSSPPSLPQTGQLNWPVPVLSALGLSLFAIGWLLRFGKRRTDED